MTFKRQPILKKIILIGLAILLLAGVLYLFWVRYLKQPGMVACTQEAKICPDGSSVGRVGPNCDFAPCPEVTNLGWKTFVDDKTGTSFQYPESLSTVYIETVDWPPKIMVSSEPFNCVEGGSEVMQSGQISNQVINSRTYCVTKEDEGAAGSTYTQYT